MSGPWSGTPRPPRPGCRQRVQPRIPCGTGGGRGGAGLPGGGGLVQASGRRRQRQRCEQPQQLLRCRPRSGLADHACHVILRTLDPCFLLRMASHDVASITCPALGRGVTRSKRLAMQCVRKAAENGNCDGCLKLARNMYGDQPYAREVGHVGETAGVATSAGIMEGHDVPPDVLFGVVHWLRTGGHNPIDTLPGFRRMALEGAKFCRNEGCEVVGLLKVFKVCPQCKYARYCGDACQKQDWIAGGHKLSCGKLCLMAPPQPSQT